MKRYLGIDYGAKRIGLAVGDDVTRFASPVTTVQVAGAAAQQAQAVARVAKEYDFDALVVGLPLNMDDSEGPAAKGARVFGELLARQLGKPVHYVDERLSSHAADELLRPADLTRKKKRARQDRVAAQVLLQTFLDQGQQTELENGERASDAVQRGPSRIHGARDDMTATFGVIFDMDGVLIDSADKHLESWKILASEHGRVVDEQVFARTFGRTNADIVPILFGVDDPQTLRELGERKEAIYRDLIRDNPPLVEGAARLIAELHEAGVPMAIGSSGPPANIELVRQALGATSAIPHMVSGDDITRGKPDPEVFIRACGKLGLPPGQCVVIEDAPVGVQAAKAAGAAAVAVLIHHGAAAFPTADLLVRKLEDLTVDALAALVKLS